MLREKMLSGGNLIASIFFDKVIFLAVCNIVLRFAAGDFSAPSWRSNYRENMKNR